MTSSQPKFPRRVRIHGGECGAVARALHHAVQKDALMSYEQTLTTRESSLSAQAGSGKVLDSTRFERKQMSTKTSIKRVALVAVASLGFGLVSVAPSNAADNAVIKYKAGESVAAAPWDTGTGIAGGANTVTLDVVTPNGANDKRRYITVSGAGSTIVSAPQATSIATNGLSAIYAKNKTDVLTISTPTAGTITVSSFAESATDGIFSATAEETVVITVLSAAVANIYAKSVVYGYVGDTSTVAAATATTDAAWSVNASSSASSTPVAHISVLQQDANGTALTSGWKVIAVSTTIGTLQTTKGTNSANYVTATPGNSNPVGFWIAPTGQSGSGTVTVAVNGVTVKTYAVSFYGTLATLTATVVNKQIRTSATKTGAVTVVGKDALGNVVPVTPTVSSATTASIASGTCSASTLTTASSCDLTAGATAGSSVVTFTSGSITTTATVAAAGQPTAVALAFDKATYAPGEKFTLTLTGTNTAGVPGDGTYSALLGGALTTSSAISTTLFGASVALVDGKATATGFMPLSGGPLTVSGTTGADATTASVAVSATATVVNPAQDAADAATDAALEAIDAANAAVDAANQATEAADAATVAAEEARDAADAATAAVEALAADVAKMINEIKAQLSAMAKTIARIAKRVK